MKRMKGKILVDNTGELIRVVWDGTRFAITQQYKNICAPSRTIILNPREMFDLIEFAGKLGDK